MKTPFSFKRPPAVSDFGCRISGSELSSVLGILLLGYGVGGRVSGSGLCSITGYSCGQKRVFVVERRKFVLKLDKNVS